MKRAILRLTAEEFGRSSLNLGRADENIAVRVEIDLSRILAQEPTATAHINVENPSGTEYAAVTSMDGTKLIWDVTKADNTVEGTGRAQLTVKGPNGEVLKSAVAVTRVGHSIRGEGPAPDPVQNWVDDATNKLSSVVQAGEEAEKATDKANAAAEAANTAAKKAEDAAAGNVFAAATDEEISNRSGEKKAIVCTNMDYAVKAAMCDGKGAAWTDAEQKAARERMDIDKPYEVIEEITLAEESSIVRTIEPNGTPYNFAVIMLRAEFPAIEKTGNIYISYKIGNINRQLSSYFLSPYKADAVKYGYSKVWVENSRYRSGWWTCVENDGQFAQYYENPVLQDKYSVADGNIIGFTTSVIAAATKITVYGVRT